MSSPEVRSHRRLEPGPALEPRPPGSEGDGPVGRLCLHLGTLGNRLLAAVPGTAAWYGRALRRLSPHDVPAPLLRGHADLDGLRIAFVSDLQAGSYLRRPGVARLAERIAAARPDVLALGGDLINSRPRELDLLAPLAEVPAPLGVFAVPGNHDRTWCALPQWRRSLEAMGVGVLVNEGVRLHRGRASLWLGGLDDYGEGSIDVGAALDGREAGEPTLVLAHQPDTFAEMLGRDVDLVLSGHTHGGQVRLGPWIPVKHSAFGWLEGLHAHGEQRLYVSRGVGASVLPIRIGAPPEIPILELTT